MGVIRVVGTGFLGLTLMLAPCVAFGEEEAVHGEEVWVYGVAVTYAF